MLAKRTTPPRFLETRGARLRLAYHLYGWQVLLVCLLVVPFVMLLAWIAAARGNVPVLPGLASTERGFVVASNDAVFHEEILYAAAHWYASEHNGRLPDSAGWQGALRPYLARAKVTNPAASFASSKGAEPFVMNRALSGATLSAVPNARRTLLFWQAVTNRADLPPSAYLKAKSPFTGVTCAGDAYFLVPTGKADEPLFWQPPLLSRP